MEVLASRPFSVDTTEVQASSGLRVESPKNGSSGDQVSPATPTEVAPRSLTPSPPPAILITPPPKSLLRASSQPPAALNSLLSLATQGVSNCAASDEHPTFLSAERLPNSDVIIHYRPAKEGDLDEITDIRNRISATSSINRYVFPKQDEYPKDMARLNKSAVEATFYNPKAIMLIAEVAGRVPGSAPSSRRNSIASIVEDEQKTKPVRREIIGVVELYWGGKTRKSDAGTTKPGKPFTKTQLSPIIHKALSSLSRSTSHSRRKSLETVLSSPTMTYDQDGEAIKDHWQIGSVAVLPKHRGLGIGGRLLNLVLATCEARGEVVCATAVPGQESWYEKMGLTPYGEVEHESGKWVALVRQPARRKSIVIGEEPGRGVVEMEA